MGGGDDQAGDQVDLLQQAEVHPWRESPGSKTGSHLVSSFRPF